MSFSSRFATAILATSLLLLLSAATPKPAQAQMLRTVAQDGLYGAGIGAMIGVAQVLLYKDNQDKEAYRITTGAAYGLIAGVIFGFFDAQGAFASYDARSGQVVFGLPRLEYIATPEEQRVQTRLFEAKF